MIEVPEWFWFVLAAVLIGLVLVKLLSIIFVKWLFNQEYIKKAIEKATKEKKEVVTNATD